MRTGPAAPARIPWTRAHALHVLAAAVVAAAALAACGPPARLAPVTNDALLVASGRAGAVHRLDPAGGRLLGAPLPVPGNPHQIAPAPAGGAVVLSRAPGRGCRLTHLAPPGDARAGQPWVGRPLLSLPEPQPCTLAHLAGDGRRFAVVAIPAPPGAPGPAAQRGAPGPACRLLVFDLAGPAPEAARPPRELTPCPPDTLLTAVAAHDGPEGPRLHVGVWRAPRPERPGGSGLLLAIDPATGAVLARAELPGAPERLVGAPAPDRAGRRLYAVEGAPGPEERDPGRIGAPRPRWRLLALEPVALTVTGAVPLAADGEEAPPAVAIAPDGARAFVLVRAAGRHSALLALDATTGAAGPALLLPGEALGGLVATPERVYVPDALGRSVWVVDLRSWRFLGSVPAGEGPVAITRSPPP